MVTPFVPVPVPMEGTTSGSCRARPNDTSPLDSLSGSTPGRSPWVKGTGAWASTVVGPRLPQACPSSDAYKGVVSFSDPGTPGDSWARPLTPTLLGYEVMEERAKFTVYKVLVRRNPEENWVIFRRYTDFSRLNDKLKELFPRFRLALPPKRWFRDNYDVEFLEERQLGLQAFLQNLIAHKDITNSEAVRQFLCLDDPPGPFDSLEESRAFCETLEETNHRLQRELLDKQRQIDSLKTALDERQTRIGMLEKILNGEVPFPEGQTLNSGTLSALDRENRADTDTTTAHRETEGSGTVSSTMGADQDTCPETRSLII
uniref:Sorting nexin-16 n=1 Tax=Esox lucius TaxID=8010 RepID=A0AAY5KRS9_ESOLU